MSKSKTLKKYRIKYGLEKGKKKIFVKDGNQNEYFVKPKPKRMTVVNQFKSRGENPKPSLDVETLDNGVLKSKSWYDILIKEKRKWKSCETE